MAEGPSKREQLREERRRQILEAALVVFGQKGFHAANVSDVAAEAGVSQGTIYWYFESKDDLLEAALMSFVDDVGHSAIEAVEPCRTASERLRVLADNLVSLAEMAEGLFTLFLEFWASSPRRDVAGQLWTGVLRRYKDLVVDIIEEGVSEGEFKPVDAESLVWALMAAYDGLAAYVMLIPELDLAAVSRTFVETLLQGLEADKSDAPRGKE
jgi:TetR/AcrR family acrAB operon transcriptional repressor